MTVPLHWWHPESPVRFAQVTALHVGLGAKTSLCPMSFSDVTPGAAEHSWGNERTGAATAVASAGYSQWIPCFQMDEIVSLLNLDPPTLIKIDVDGPEFDVLQGAAQTLESRTVRSLLVEIDRNKSSSIIAFLQDKGFQLTREHPRGPKLANYIFRSRQPAVPT